MLRQQQMRKKQVQHQKKQVSEGLEEGDLKRLVTAQIQIDRYNSKMGEDDEIVVVSFKVSGKNPANDLMNFIEFGYEFVLDADVSTGEIEDGDYLVFMELPRRTHVSDQIMEILKDMRALTDITLEEWVFTYYKNIGLKIPVTKEELELTVPDSPKEYREKFEVFESILDRLKLAAGVQTYSLSPRNKETDGLRLRAGVPFKDIERAKEVKSTSRTER